MIELRGVVTSWTTIGSQPAFDAVFNILIAQANQALASLPPPTADQPPVSAAQPPGSAGPLADTQLPETNAELPPGPGDMSIDDLADEIPELTPAEIAVAAGIAGGTALLGSLLMLGASGVRRDEAIAAIRDLLRGHLPEDPYEAWKRKYEALGWKYSEKNGVGTFDPVEGARNEGGEIYSAENGGFVAARSRDATRPAAACPVTVTSTSAARSGATTPMASSAAIPMSRTRPARPGSPRRQNPILRRCSGRTPTSPSCSARSPRRGVQGAEMQTYFKARDELLGALGEQRDREDVDAFLDKSRSGLFDDLSDRLLKTPADNDYRKGLEKLVPLADVIGNQMREGYTPTYTYIDAAKDTLLQSGAAALDAVLTQGLASSAVGSGLAMRDASRAGAGGDIIVAGAKSAITDFLFGKAIHYGAGYAGEAWRAGKNAVAGVAESGADLLARRAPRSPQTWSRRCRRT